MGNKPKLILASKSLARREMLGRAGLMFEALPADLDEEALIQKLQDLDVAPADIALELAKEKALSVTKDHPDVLVVGGDQILQLDDEILGKAKNETEARQKLEKLKGREHDLISAVAVVKGETVLWTHVDQASLRMHDFDDAFLSDYCEAAGSALSRSVGAYELESHGAWLFDKVEGDFFTILGMPLLPLLSYLRSEHGVMP